MYRRWQIGSRKSLVVIETHFSIKQWEFKVQVSHQLTLENKVMDRRYSCLKINCQLLKKTLIRVIKSIWI
jgi:hypothetical protein